MDILYHIQKWLKTLRQRLRPVHYLLAIFALIAVITVVIILTATPPPDPVKAASMAPLIDRAVLRVGVRKDVEGFCQADETGEYAGLEADLGRLLSKSVFGEVKVEFVPVDFTTRSVKLREKEADVVLALSPSGYTGQFGYSQPYYSDIVGVMTAKDSPLTSPAQLGGKVIGCIMRTGNPDHHGAKTVLQQFDKKAGLGAVIVDYSSIPDLLLALKAGKIDAAVLESALINKYYNESYSVMSEGIGAVEYCAVVPLENPALIQIMDAMLKQMRADGSLEALYAQYGF